MYDLAITILKDSLGETREATSYGYNLAISLALLLTIAFGIS